MFKKYYFFIDTFEDDDSMDQIYILGEDRDETLYLKFPFTKYDKYDIVDIYI